MVAVLILTFSIVRSTGLVAEEKQVLPISSLAERGVVAHNSKPGGIVIGPAMPRAFHYGGRQAVRPAVGEERGSNPGCQWQFFRRGLRQQAGAGPLAGRFVEPVDGARARQPILAIVFRRRAGQNCRGFWKPGRASQPPTVA